MNYKYSFQNDYTEGAHPNILQALTKVNLKQEEGYGNDSFCEEAISLLKKHIKNPTAAIHFVSGGTQANLISLASILKPYESVIAATTAHINVHETGAIESTGHKITTLQTTDGKITAENISEIMEQYMDEHMVKPKAVLITYSTELGTIYTKRELKKISIVCKKYNLYLYVDGARLGVGLTAKTSDISLSELSSLVDMFYIGGTKNGALLGEAIVINNPKLQEGFRYHLKQRGALLAKGRILGIQFIELFTNDLYFTLARHSNIMAEKLTKGIRSYGYDMLTNSPTNQIFPILPNSIVDTLNKTYGFFPWAEIDTRHTAIRLVTSWATKEVAVDEFLADLKRLS